MEARNSLRVRYLAKALLWAVVAVICAIPAHPYLRAFAEYIRGGLNANF
jgi:hypothetical protein